MTALDIATYVPPSVVPRWTDVSEWPLAVVRSPTVVSDGQLRSYLGEADEFLKLVQHPYWALVDLRPLAQATPTQRKMMADAEQRWRTLSGARQLQVQVVLLDGSLQRGLVTAVRWLSKLPYPERIMGDEASARLWLRGHMAARGVDPFHLPRT